MPEGATGPRAGKTPEQLAAAYKAAPKPRGADVKRAVGHGIDTFKKRVQALRLRHEVRSLQTALESAQENLGTLVLTHRPPNVDVSVELPQLSQVQNELGDKQSAADSLRQAKGGRSVLKQVEAEIAELRDRQRRLMIAIGQKAEALKPDMPGAMGHYGALERLRPSLESKQRNLQALEQEVRPLWQDAGDRLRRLKRPLAIVGTVLIGILLLTVFMVRPDTAETYYPLDEGRTWEYEGFGTGIIGRVGFRATVTNFPQRELKGRTVTPREFVVYSDLGAKQRLFSFVARDDKGVCEYATQDEEAPEPEVANRPNYELQYPIRAGTTWNGTHKSALRDEVRVPVKFTIESVGDTVTVPAGTFTKCIKVVGLGTTESDAGPFSGKATTTCEYTVWYAPGVGMVRIVEQERTTGFMGSSTDVNMQLTRFTSKGK